MIDGIEIDMSGYLFVFSLNDISKMNNALLSRVGQNIIEIKDYTAEDKVNIIVNYSVPKFEKQLGLNKNDIILKDDIIYHIINKYIPKNIGGMRELNGIILKIMRLIIYYRVMDPDKYEYPYNVTKECIDIIISNNVADELNYSMYN